MTKQNKNRQHKGMPSKEQILEFIQTSDTPAGKREIAKAFGLKGQEKITLKKRLKDMAEEGLIVFGGNVNQTLGMTAIVKSESGTQAQIAVLLPDIQMFEHIGRHPECHTLADGLGLFYQGYHPARRLGGSPVIV